MSLPQSLRNSVTPPELELIACQELVEIIPLISMEKTAFISGAYGPLRPPHRVKIPIWMALNLKSKRKCHIIAPEWLNVDYLQDRLTEETSNLGFSSLPFRFAEISKVLLDVYAHVHSIHHHLADSVINIREARQAKSREGVKQLDHSELTLTRLCSMEINEIRPFFVQAMGVFTHLQPQPDNEE